jgi:hypothetical protein
VQFGEGGFRQDPHCACLIVYSCRRPSGAAASSHWDDFTPWLIYQIDTLTGTVNLAGPYRACADTRGQRNGARFQGVRQDPDSAPRRDRRQQAAVGRVGVFLLYQKEGAPASFRLKRPGKRTGRLLAFIIITVQGHIVRQAGNSVAPWHNVRVRFSDMHTL